MTWRSLTLGEQLAAQARRRPDRFAIHCGDHSLTYGELDARATRLARWLQSRGVGQGDRVAVLMTNRVELVEVLFACCRLGAIGVPVNFRLVPAEVAHILADCDPRLIVTEEKLADALPEKHLVAGPEYEAALERQSAEPLNVHVPEDAPAVIMYTSGTTGLPKGAVLTHLGLMSAAYGALMMMGVWRDDEVWASGLPLFHIGGFGDLCVYLPVGGTFVSLPSGGFDAAELVGILERHGVTGCFLVPTQWQDVCALPGIRERRLPLRRAAWGAAPSPMALLELLARTFPGIDQINAFGQTETSGATTLLRGEDAARKMGSVGLPLATVEARIVDDRMKDVEPGEVGEIVYRGPCITPGYWQRPDADAEAFAGGWFHSGDLCRADEEGYIYVVGRRKDMIVSGGENVFPAEVEDVLSRHPLVAEAVVIGVPHSRWGETPCAVIRPVDASRPPSEHELIDLCREHLASYKKPTSVVIVEDLPLNASGKVLKHVLRERVMTSKGALTP
jgi:acyl-CoA synthetase (AMP-forming)/AMP-acid ligase II